MLRGRTRLGAIKPIHDCSVLYQGALAEVFVPYQDPDQNWFYRTFMDEGEFGLGALSSPLARGLDVPENAVLMNATISAAIPDPDVPVVPLELQNVVGIFERVTGNPVWRHYEQFASEGPLYEGRAEVELVVRMIAQAGNYDYMIDWVFTQAGAIRVDVSLPVSTWLKACPAAPSPTVTAPPTPPSTALSLLPNFRPSITATISTSASIQISTGAKTASRWEN